MDRTSPYQGLEAFAKEDAAFFFGRDRDIRIIVANVFASPLTVLHGPSGVGKTSVLNAGVVPQLTEREGVAVVVLREWTGDVTPVLRQAVATLEGAHRASHRRVALVLDQFEDFFLDREDDKEFVEELVAALARTDLPLSVLISIREESLAKLDRLEGRVPGLFDGVLGIDRLDREAGREAILGPQRVWNDRAPPAERFQIDGELVDAVLDGAQTTRGRIEAAHLQLVMQELWDAERAAESQVLRKSTLDDLGGADAIVRGHVTDTLEALDPGQQELAAEILGRLVTPSGTRLAQRRSDLEKWAGVGEGQVQPLLERLTAARLLRPVADGADDDSRYEVIHDLLTDAVLAWSSEHAAKKLAAEERARWLKRLKLAAAAGAALVIVLAIVTFLAIYAWTQRQTARSQAYSASALRQAEVDQELGLALAVQALRERLTDQAEDALRSTLARSHERTVLRSSDAPVRIVSFSRDGTRLLTAGDDSVVRIWNAASGAQLLALPREPGGVLAASFCPDAKRIAVAGESGAKILISGGQAIVLERSAPAEALSCTRDGRVVAVVGASGQARIYSATSGAKIATLGQPADPALHTVAFSRRGDLVVAGGDAGAVVWRVADQRRMAVFRPQDVSPSRTITSAAFSPSGTHVVTASSDADVRIWSVTGGAEPLELRGHGSFVSAAEYSNDGTLVVSASADRTARIWDAATGEEIAVLRGHERAVRDAAFSPDGKLLATTSEDGTARLWAIPVTAVLRDKSNVIDAGFSQSGQQIVTVSEGSVLVWDGRTFRKTNRLGVPGVTSATLSPDGKDALTLDDEGRARLWSLARRGRPVSLGGSPSNPVTGAAFAPDGESIVIAPESGPLRSIDLSGHVVRELARPPGQAGPAVIAFSPSGGEIALAGLAEGSIWIVDAQSGAVMVHMAERHEGLQGVAFSRDGSALVTVGGDDARVWDADTGDLQVTLRGHEKVVLHASFSADGRLVATGSADDTTRVWDAETGVELLALPGLNSAFSPDDALILTAGPSVTARVYVCDLCGTTSELRSRAQELITRPLTRKELELYVG